MPASSNISINDREARRVLAVVDWTLEPPVVAAAISAHARQDAALFGLLVPARLHGLDWTGDPHASRPCAELALRTLEELCRDAGIRVGATAVGDPEAAPAIAHSLADWPAEEVLLFGRKPTLELPGPLSLRRRVERSTGLPVARVDLSESGWTGSGRLLRRAPRCVPLRAQLAQT
jgi:hypothetical protein